MSDIDQHPSNQTNKKDPAAPRRGRAKGLPKPPGSGRKKGTPNRVGKEARELADKYTPKAFLTLAKLLDSQDGKVAAMAAQQILDRRYGRPVNPTELTGRDGTPLGKSADEVTDIDAVRRMLFVMGTTVRERLPKGSPQPETWDGMKRVVAGEAWSPDEPEEVAAREERARAPAWLARQSDKPNAELQAEREERRREAEEAYATAREHAAERQAAPWRVGEREHTPKVVRMPDNRTGQ